MALANETEARAERLAAIVRGLSDNEPCDYDADDYCRHHNSTRPCKNADARAELYAYAAAPAVINELAEYKNHDGALTFGIEVDTPAPVAETSKLTAIQAVIDAAKIEHGGKHSQAECALCIAVDALGDDWDAEDEAIIPELIEAVKDESVSRVLYADADPATPDAERLRLGERQKQ